MAVKTIKSNAFRLSFYTDNAAFDENPSAEVARLLRQTADRIEMGRTDGNVMDYNGNKIGAFELTNAK